MKRGTIAILLMTTLLNWSPVLYAQQLANAPALPVPKGKHLLFFLQTSPESHTLIYELNYNSEGILDPDNPVKGARVSYEAQGGYKVLGQVEKRAPYGIRCKDIGNGGYEIRLSAYKKFPMYLLKSEKDNKYHMYIQDMGQQLLLKRVFVKVNGGSFWFPKIIYIDLITTNSETGIEILKRINI